MVAMTTVACASAPPEPEKRGSTSSATKCYVTKEYCLLDDPDTEIVYGDEKDEKAESPPASTGADTKTTGGTDAKESKDTDAEKAPPATGSTDAPENSAGNDLNAPAAASSDEHDSSNGFGDALGDDDDDAE